jgi:hypothetical protein
MPEKLLNLEGKTPQSIYEDVTKVGISPSAAAILVGSWIYEVFGKAKRVFNYKQPFPANEAHCVAKFQRTFAHEDWVDGENVVQAGQTPGEEGFNARFHKIEDDLNAIRTDLVQAFSCMNEMRTSIRILLDEIRTEINLTNNDIFKCCEKTDSGGVSAGTRFGTLVDSSKFITKTTFDGKPVTVWRTPDDKMLVLPAVVSIGVDVFSDDRVRRIGGLARHIEENAKIRTKLEGQPFTKEKFIDEFGDEVMHDGRLVKDVLKIFPNKTSFESLDGFILEFAEREAAALRTAEGTDAAVASALGAETSIENVKTAPVEKLRNIPPAARIALLRAGFTDVEKLAAGAPKDIMKVMKREGVSGVTAGDVAEWTATAKVLERIG